MKENFKEKTTMNENEKKMIEEMAEVINQASDKCFATTCEDCKYYRADDVLFYCKGVFEAEVLYNAGYRKVAEDEIVVKKSEYVAWLDCEVNNYILTLADGTQWLVGARENADGFYCDVEGEI